MVASSNPSLFRPLCWSIFVLSFLNAFVAAHDHHEELPEGQVITFDPVDSILWTHIVFMSLSFGILFPMGMVCPSLHSLLTDRFSGCQSHDGTSLFKPWQVC